MKERMIAAMQLRPLLYVLKQSIRKEPLEPDERQLDIFTTESGSDTNAE